MPLSPVLAVWLGKQGHDAIHALQAGLGWGNFRICSKRKGVIITDDLDFPRLLALVQAKDPGIILFRGGNYSEQEALERLTHLFEVIPQEELPNSIVIIEKSRIRRRRLPV